MRVALNTSESPRVSILLLAQRDAARLARCLDSLAHHVPAALAHEVILVCNAATPDVLRLAARDVVGLRTEVSEVNLGFGGGCNRAARLARGEYLMFLNDDTEVGPYWLEPLVETLDRRPRAASVGSRVLFPDGSVQEAGSVLFDDGTTYPIGRHLPPGSKRHVALRRVDYCSACSLLVRREAFEAVGGFEPKYFPAYYEDVDLALKLRRDGWDALYDGRSQLRHLESASSAVRFKHFLFRRNHATLLARWAGELAAQLPPPPPAPDGYPDEALRPAREHACATPRRALVVEDMLPAYGSGAGFGTTRDIALELALEGWSLSILPTKHPGADPMTVAGDGWEVVDGPLEAHLADARPGYDLVVLCRPDNARDGLAAVRRLQPQARVLYVAEALFSARLAREADLAAAEGRVADERRLRAEAAAQWAVEVHAVRGSDRAVAVSEDEAAVLRAIPGAPPVDVVLGRQAVGTPLTPPALGHRRDLVFVAGWLPGADSPNGDGLRWFARDVLPRLAARVPWARLLVTGGDPPPELVAEIAALAGPRVRFTGFVEDLEALYAGARAAVSPVRYGAGVKFKTSEALQHGVPVVATTCGAEGIAVPEGLSPMTVTDDAQVFADALTYLLLDPHAWLAARRDTELLRESQLATGRRWRAVFDAALRGSAAPATPQELS